MLEQKRVMMLVTENCNLDCIYCYEHQKNSNKMSFATAKNIINKQLYGIKKNQKIILELFGGEAFLNFDLIKSIDNYIKENFEKVDIIYETTTNGTLIHGEIKDWLLDNKDKFFIALSLDGTKDMHDINRKFINGKGTFDFIDIEFFAKTWPRCPAKMTISEKTLPYLTEGIKYLDSLGFKCDATLAIGTEWDINKDMHILVSELEKLIEYYTENPNKQLCTMLNMDLRLIFTPIDNDYRYCGAGVDMVCFDTVGNRYPCQGFAPVSIGKDAIKFKEFEEKKFRFTEDNVCKTCSWVRLCSNCYAANLQSTGNIQKIDSNLCIFYKLCILASAKIQYNRILDKNKLDHDDQLVLKAISIIQSTMEL